ncbi:MAG: glucuronate isomerase, partial [Planctomycetota bacterium]
HEYFRRVLCGLLGAWVEAGVLPDDRAHLHDLIAGICCDNARRRFGIRSQEEVA